MGQSQQRLGRTTDEIKILMIGLDEVGKTTLLNNLKLGEITTSTPSTGFNVETLKYKNLKIISWGAGIRDKIRPLWRHYYEGVTAIILVVDSNDFDRFQIVQYVMDTILSEEELKNCVFAVVANKQDINGSMSKASIWENLNLTPISKTRPCAIFGTSGLNGFGLFEVLDWILEAVSKSPLEKNGLYDDKRKTGQENGVKKSIVKKLLNSIKDYFIS